MWSHFDGKPYNQQELAAHIQSLNFTDWKPQFITLHNTSDPDLKTYIGWPPAKRRQYIHNVQGYYENDLGWHAGPHFFVPPSLPDDPDVWAFGFSNPVASGVHASCFNKQSIGIEMFGEYDREPFDTGPGASVRDHAVYLMALLCKQADIDPNTLHFHIECARDNHDCPGTHARNKADLIQRIKDQLVTSGGVPIPPLVPSVPPQTPPLTPPLTPIQRFTNIVATVFGGSNDPNTSAYDGHVIGDSELGVALPARLHGPLPKVRVTCGASFVTCNIVDIGPWNINDPYWETGRRPQAESGIDMRGRHTNHAGIDLTPGAAKALGIDGKGEVDWEFVS